MNAIRILHPRLYAAIVRALVALFAPPKGDPDGLPLGVEGLIGAIFIVGAIALSALYPGNWF